MLRTSEIAANYSFQAEEAFVLSAASWFHDAGHLFGKPDGHEVRSVSIMKEFLRNEQVEISTLEKIQGCIMATKIPQDPITILEEIICDADTYHLGTDEFLYTDILLKGEFELRNHTKYDDWDMLTLNVLEMHTYFTSYCKHLLNKGKQKNIEMVREKIGVGLWGDESYIEYCSVI